MASLSLPATATKAPSYLFQSRLSASALLERTSAWGLNGGVRKSKKRARPSAAHVASRYGVDGWKAAA